MNRPPDWHDDDREEERLDEVIEERRRFQAAGALIGGVILVTVVGFGVLAYTRANAGDPAATTTPEPTTTGAVTATEPRLLQTVDLRSAPSEQVAIVARLGQHETIRVVGRSADRRWIALGPADRPTIVGWVPAEQVEGVDPAALTVLADPRGPGHTAAPTLTPDLPDLVVETVIARENRLLVTVLNQGAGDAPGTILVSVNDGAPLPLEVARPGEPLPAGQQVNGTVPGSAVQIRGFFRIRVLLDPPVDEEHPDNNTWDGIVEPDIPNDIEIFGVGLDPTGGHLVVVLRNNSPVPVTATFTVSVRAALPSTDLLGREIVTEMVESHARLDVHFPELVGVPLDEITVRLSSDGVDDAVIANNTYPR